MRRRGKGRQRQDRSGSANAPAVSRQWPAVEDFAAPFGTMREPTSACACGNRMREMSARASVFTAWF